MGRMELWALLALAAAAPTLAAPSAEELRQSFTAALANYQQTIDSGAGKSGSSAAVDAARKALVTGIAALGEANPNIPNLRYNYGLELREAGDPDAREVLRTALEDYERVYGGASIELVPVLLQLGGIYLDDHYDSGINTYLNRALNISATAYGKDSWQYGRLLVQIGGDVAMQSRTHKGRNKLSKGRKLLARTLGTDSVDYALAAFKEGKVRLGMRRYSDATVRLNEALTVFASPAAADDRMELLTRAFLVRALEEQGESDRATEHCIAIGRLTPAEGTRRAEPIYRIPPRYPPSALMMGKEGQVLLEFDVDEMGFVRNARVVEASNDLFVNASLTALNKFRYAPRFVDGAATVAKGEQHIITFELAD